MNRCGYRLPRSMWVWLGSSLLLATPASLGEKPWAGVDGEPHARGATLLRSTFASRGEVWRVSLDASRDGEEFYETGVDVPGPTNLPRSVAYDENTTTILVPALALFWPERFFFDGPGTYWFRWKISFRDREKPRTVPDQLDTDIDSVVVEQVVALRLSRPADSAFIERMSAPDFLRHLFGDDFFDRKTDVVRERMLAPEGADYRALMVIRELLKATRADEPGDVVGPRGGLENAITWADNLIALAKKFPESSYSPYAAYYAGCCYLTALGHETKQEHGELISPTAKKRPWYAKSEQALSIGIEDGDAYLRPRALYMQAFLRVLAADFEDADRLLEEAIESTGPAGTIADLVGTLRRSIVRTKEELRRNQEQGQQ